MLVFAVKHKKKMDSQPQRKLHFHENDEDSRENNENSIVNDEGNASVHLWESIELQNMDDTLEIDGEEEIRNVYGLQENICQAQENFIERSTSLQALTDENQLMKIKSHFSGLSLDNSKLNESPRNTCCNTSDCQETRVSDKISGQEQLNTVQKMSTRKQMPCEGLPKVVPNDPNLKCIETCHICQHEKVCGRINVQEPLNVVKRISTWKQMPYEGIPRMNVQEQFNTVKEMSTWKQMPLEGLLKNDRSLCYDFDLPGVPLYLRNTCLPKEELKSTGQPQ